MPTHLGSFPAGTSVLRSLKWDLQIPFSLVPFNWPFCGDEPCGHASRGYGGISYIYLSRRQMSLTLSGITTPIVIIDWYNWAWNPGDSPSFRGYESCSLIERAPRKEQRRAFIHSSIIHLPHDLLPACTQKPRRPSSPECHKRSSTKSYAASPILTSDPSDHVLSYQDYGFRQAGGTSSTPPPSPGRIWRHGSRRFQCQRRAPPTSSGI